MPSAKARFWILTIPKEDWSPPGELPEQFQFLKGQLELAASGFEHWQVCVGYHKQVRLPKVKSDFTNTTHAEPTRSEAAEQYVCKEETSVPGTRFSLGEKSLNRNSAEFWAEQYTLARQGNIENIAPDVMIRYYNTIKRIAFDHASPPTDLNDCAGVWIYGPPGVGKSHFARNWFPDLYLKALNKWWDGYKGQKAVLLDDVGHEHKQWIGFFLKIWADKYSFSGEIKGGTMLLRPDRVLVTSNYTIQDLFSDDIALCEALKRRFYLIHIPNKRH